MPRVPEHPNEPLLGKTSTTNGDPAPSVVTTSSLNPEDSAAQRVRRPSEISREELLLPSERHASTFSVLILSWMGGAFGLAFGGVMLAFLIDGGAFSTLDPVCLVCCPLLSLHGSCAFYVRKALAC